MKLHSRVCFVKLTNYIAITLNEKTCLSVCRRRQCPTERGDLLGTQRGDLLSKVARKHRLELCSTNKVYENWVKLLNLNKKNFTVRKLKNFNDEINSFFKDSYCSKIWNYVKLIIKISMKWKKKRSFRVPPSTLLQDED